MTPVYDLQGQRNVWFLSRSQKEQKSRKFFHCNFSINFFWLTVIYVKFQVFRVGIYVMRIRKYKNLTFELNTETNLKIWFKEPTGQGRKKWLELKFLKTSQIHWIGFLRTSIKKKETLECVEIS